MNVIIKRIIDHHTNSGEPDGEQLEAIFSIEPNLVVEAPAGCGKTRTMVSKIAYLIATKQIPHPKKVLALTFSINAAFKIRKDIRQQLPLLLSASPNLSRQAIQVVFATNYHGLCRHILSRYGYLIDPALCKIDSLRGIGIDINDDEDYTKRKLHDNLTEWGIQLTNDEIDTLIQYSDSVKLACDVATRRDAIRFLQKNTDNYLRIVKEKYLPQQYILFDSILLFTRRLFHAYPQILAFYRSYFPIVIVDEFQDTNILQWTLLQDIVGRCEESKNRLYIFGDRYQKIYEFIGAMHGIMDKAKTQYKMLEIQLKTNHRFKNNQALLNFDAGIRHIAQNPLAIQVDKISNIEVVELDNQDEEAEHILAHIQMLLDQEANNTVAVLMRAGKNNRNTQNLVEHFNAKKPKGFSYFFALYSDEDQEYVDFHRNCLTSLYSNLTKFQNFRSLCDAIEKDLKLETPSETWESLQILLDTFVIHISREFRFLSFEEKVVLVIDTFRNNALKQYLMYVTLSRVTLSTVHGSKGLEWDYVILPDMERNSFPTYPGLCKECPFCSNCQIDWTKIDEDSKFAKLFRQELNVFYVGGTRARKAVYFSYSKQGLNSQGKPRANNLSCFLSLPGLQISE